MTDRVRTLTVLLDKDWRDDDVQHVIDAIRMVRGVADVQPTVETAEKQMAVWKAKDELRREILQKVVELLK